MRLLLLLTAFPLLHACSLQCAQDAPCVSGSTTFSEHHLADGTVHEFHKEVTRNNEYCSCPHGWTGLLCDVKFEGCDGSHKCYHGGNCIPGLKDAFGNEQLYCSCENAVDEAGNNYVGRFCEHASNGDESEQCDDHFCVNGGSCNSDDPSGETCTCPDGFNGPHCQYRSGTTPVCGMDCQNGGTCILGDKERIKDGERYQYWDHEGSNNMFCSCPEGYDGPRCEISKTPCGSGHCFNNGECIERSVDGTSLHHCDCSSSNEGDVSFAGRYCQYEATSYCTKTSGLQGHLFCVNQGTCKTDPYDGCSCPKGFTGFSCEYVTSAHTIGAPPDADEDEDDDFADTFGGDIDNGKTVVDVAEDENPCTLDCDNGGVCRNGLKDVSSLDELGSSNFAERHKDFQHCVCPEGFAGVQCEHKVQVCNSGEHMCFHGGKCVEVANKDECDCNAADSATAEAFGGRHCEHPATEICTQGPRSPGVPLSFCVNGASCVRQVTASEGHAGCNCQAGWSGRHCELRDGVDYDDDDDGIFAEDRTSGDDQKRDPLLIAVLFFSMMAIVVVAAFWVNQRRRRHKRESSAMSTSMRWESNYSDKPKPQINIAPRRSSTLAEEGGDEEDVYMASVASPNRDPMATHLAPQIAPKEEPTFEDGDTPKIYIGPPRDEDGHELHSINII